MLTTYARMERSPSEAMKRALRDMVEHHVRMTRELGVTAPELIYASTPSGREVFLIS